MKLYYGTTEIDVHPSKVEHLKSSGWSESPPEKKKDAKSVAPKS